MSLSFNPTTSPLFVKLGKIIHAAKTLNTARLTTVPTEVEDILDQYAAGSIDLQSIPDTLADATSSWQSAGDSTLSTLQQVFQNTIIQYVKEDEQQPTDSLEDALSELIRQMEETNTYVEHNAPTATLATVAATGNGTVVASTYDRFGRRLPFAYNEIFNVECTDDTTSGAEIFQFRGEPSASKLSQDWPAGSGTDTTLTAIRVTDRRNLVTNGSFETADSNDATLPNGWTHASDSTFTPALSSVEEQTVAISGTPTGGWYALVFATNYQTIPLAYNASANAVQSALRAIPGLEQVTVTATGTSPNLTHTITFTGVTNPSELTSVDELSGGTPVITHNTTVAGSANVHHGARSWSTTGDGATDGEILSQKLTGLTAGTQYVFSVALKRSGSSPSAGTLRFALKSNAGSTMTDDEGNANQIDVAYTSIGTSFALATGTFRTPSAMPPAVYLSIQQATAFTSGTVVHLDSLILAEATELYDGGPSVAVISGATDFAAGDKFTLTVANAYGDEFQQWFNRFCDMESLEKQLPSASGVSASVNEVQGIDVDTPTPSSGTFTLTFDGQTTANIAWNASAADVHTALEALSNIEVGDLVESGGVLPTSVGIEFAGTLAGRNLSAMTINTAGLSGGTYAIIQGDQGVSYLDDSVFIT